MDVDPALLSAGHVRCSLEGALLTVTLARPDARNAQTPATWRALAAVGAAVPAQVRVVVLAGEGASFSAGLDRAMLAPQGLPGEASLAEMGTWPPARLTAQIEEFQQAFTCWSRPGLLSVAAVQGHAVGAGFQLALACDLRVLADDARLAMLETSLGLVPDLGGTGPLVRAVGRARAIDICVTGRWVEAAEAEAIGLAQRVVPRAGLDAAVAELVAQLLAPDADAVHETVALLDAAVGAEPAVQRAAERAAQARRLRSMAARA